MADENLGVLAEFEKCPTCGSKKWLLKTLAQEAIDAGSVPADFKPQPMVMMTQPMRNPTKPPIFGFRYPNAVVCLDVCLECGAVFAAKVLKAFLELGVDQQPPRFPRMGNPR